MKKISIILLIIFFLFIFIRGAYIQKIEYQELRNGVVLKKKNGSKGSLVFFLKPSPNLDSIKFIFTGPDLADSIQIGDSVVKKANSYWLYVYKKEENKYLLDDSMEILHW